MTTNEFLEVLDDKNRMLVELVLWAVVVDKSMTPEEAEEMLLGAVRESAA